MNIIHVKDFINNIQINDIKLEIINENSITYMSEISLVDNRFLYDFPSNINLGDMNMVKEWVININDSIEMKKILYFNILKERMIIGILMLDLKKENDLKAYVSVYINKEYRNQKIAKNIMKNIFHYVFENIQYNKISTNILDDNIEGLEFCKKQNMKLEIVKRDKVFKFNKYVNLNTYGILRGEYNG